jgi:integral membrane protein (TIGR01906 family)
VTRLARIAETAGVALLWVVAILGIAVSVLTLPVFTSTAILALNVPMTAGLPTEDALHLANTARAYVADLTYDDLPPAWKGQVAFEPEAVSHLADVRGAIDAGHVASGVAALALAAWVTFCIARKRWGALRSAMRWGAILTLGLVAAAGLAGLADFESLFVRFHGVLFEPGTWMFPPDSMLIRLFPERFWVYSGVAWAIVSAVGALLLLGSSGFVPGADGRQFASRRDENV